MVAVRQNLHLIVDKGRPVDALADNNWGTTKNQVQYTWRSGLGVDAAGSLVYVAGANLNLVTLADALIQAGAVRGMQLDIHNEMVAFLSYPCGAAHVGGRSRTGSPTDPARIPPLGHLRYPTAVPRSLPDATEMSRSSYPAGRSAIAALPLRVGRSRG